MRLRTGRLFVLVVIVLAVSAGYHYYETVLTKSNPYALFVQGSTKLRLGDLAGAEKVWRDLERMGGLAPTQESALSEKFRLLDYCKKVSLSKAITHVNEALNLCRRAQPAIDEERLTAIELSMLEQALSHLECVALYRTKDERYSYLIAYTLLHLGKTEEAEPMVRALLEEQPSSPDGLVLKAIQLERNEELDEAIGACLGALQLNEDHRWANYYLACYLLQNGEMSDQAFLAAQKAAVTNKVWAQKLAPLLAYTRTSTR